MDVYVEHFDDFFVLFFVLACVYANIASEDRVYELCHLISGGARSRNLGGHLRGNTHFGGGAR